MWRRSLVASTLYGTRLLSARRGTVLPPRMGVPHQSASIQRITLAFAAVALVTALAACSSRTPDAGGDTALAHDLARVQLGASDTPRGASAPGLGGAVVTETPGAGESASAGGVATSAPVSPAAASARPTSPASPASPASLTLAALDTLPECAAASRTAQSACFRAAIAPSSARLDHVYQALVTTLRAQPSSRARTRRRTETPAVTQLRAAQRAWVALRERECRRKDQGRAASLWGASRARCFAELSTDRANELDATLARIRAASR